MKFANSLQLSWAVLGFVLGATADSGTVMDIERRADFIDIGIACGGYDVADGKLQDRVDCCETMCATALVNDPLFWSQALVGVGGYCGEYEPAPCDASKSWPITGFDNNACLAGGDGQWKRREKSLVSFGSLCAAKCADAYPLHPFDCEYMDERTDPSVNETVPEFAYYWDCMKNEAAGCENDYELTCNMGEMFDSKCVAKCSVPDGFPSKAVLPSLIGGVQMPYECPAVCELKVRQCCDRDRHDPAVTSGTKRAIRDQNTLRRAGGLEVGVFVHSDLYVLGQRCLCVAPTSPSSPLCRPRPRRRAHPPPPLPDPRFPTTNTVTHFRTPARRPLTSTGWYGER